MKRFVVQLRFIDNERRLQVRPAHRDYLRTLHEQGKLITAGPWADDSGALLIYQATDEDELDRIIAADPYTPENVVEVALRREWTPIVP
jgi:uncharacterized protein